MRQIFGNADNRDPGIVRSWQAQRDAAADRVLTRPITTRHAFIDDGNDWSLLVHVLRSQVASLDYRDIESAEIVRAHHLPAGETDVRRIKRSSFDRKWIVARDAAQRSGGADRRGFDSRQGFNAINQVLEKGGSLSSLSIPRFRKIDFDSQHFTGCNRGTLSLQTQKAVDQKACSDEHHKC